MAKMNTPDPWERQPGETQRAFEAFVAYRDMGADRSLRKVVRKVNKSLTTVGEWSAKHKWVDRVAEWDAEQDRIARQEHLAAVKEMRKRHADLGKGMLLKAARALNRMKEEDIKPGDVSRMIEVATKLERISRGDVGEVIEERDGGEATPAVTFYMPSNGRDQEEESEEE